MPRRLLLLIPLVALSLASCAGEPTGGSTDGDPPASPPAVESHVDVSDPQGSVPGFVGALDDATVERCEADANGWTAEGTVTNPTDLAQDYRIYVAFNQNRDTHGLVQVDLSAVAPGAVEHWSAHAPIDGGALSCVLRVERFDPVR